MEGDGWLLGWAFAILSEPDEEAKRTRGWRALWDGWAYLRAHPRHLLDPEDFVILDLWLAYRSGGMGGAGHLPFAGGYGEQPAALMRAFDLMSGVEAKSRERDRRR